MYFLIFTILLGLVPFLVTICSKRRENIMPIFPFVTAVFIASLYELVGSLLLKIDVEYWFSIYGLLAFSSIHYFFYNLLQKRFKKIFIVLTVVFFLFFLLSILFRTSFDFLTINSFFKAYQTIIILLFSIIWFKRIFENLEVVNLFDSPAFYFVSGLLIYYCGSVFLFLAASAIYASDKSNFQYYWLLNIILNLVLRTLLIIGIWKARQE